MIRFKNVKNVIYMKMEELNLIQKNPAPKGMKLENTYTVTEFGKKLIENTREYREEEN